MSYKDRNILINEVSDVIIANQYEDRFKHGIENHFLVDVINEVLNKQAHRIKEFADYIFENDQNVDDRHSLVCKILINTEEKSVLTIEDETIYGPNVDFIIVIDDKISGKIHIRKLKDKSELSQYEDNGYYPFGESFVNRGFIFTYEYMPEYLRTRGIDKNDKFAKELKKIENMGDNTFHLYECAVYSAGLLASVKNTIDSKKLEQ